MEKWLSSSFQARPETGLLFLCRKWCLSDIFWASVEFSENVSILVTATIILPLWKKKKQTPVADSCWYMAKPIQYCKVKKFKKKGRKQTYLAMQGLSAALRVFSCGMWDLVPWPGREPRPPALEAWNLNHWAAREVASLPFLIFSGYSYCFSKCFLAVKI